MSDIVELDDGAPAALNDDLSPAEGEPAVEEAGAGAAAPAADEPSEVEAPDDAEQAPPASGQVATSEDAAQTGGDAEAAAAQELAVAALGVAFLWFRPRSIVRYALVAMITALPWFVFATIYYGSPLPHTLIAKRAIGSAAAGQGLQLGAYLEWFSRATGASLSRTSRPPRSAPVSLSVSCAGATLRSFDCRLKIPG